MAKPMNSSLVGTTRRAGASNSKNGRTPVLFTTMLVVGAFMAGHELNEMQILRKDNTMPASDVIIRTPGTMPLPQHMSPSVSSSTELKCLDIQLDNNVNHRREPTPDQVDECLLYYPPSIYIQTVMNFVVGTPNQGRCVFGSPGGCSEYSKYIEKDRQYGNDWPPFGYTMIGKVRLENFRAAIHEVDRNQIPGAIMEMGVWRGGAMIMAAAVTFEAQSGRDLYLYDAFETIPGYKGHSEFLENSQADVESFFDLFQLRHSNVHFVKGLFKDTVPAWKKGTRRPIAVLRVDGNFYDSYQDAMYSMYEDVPVGGIVIFDDIMSHTDVMRFWQDFKADQNLPEEFIRIDKHSAWFRKRVDVKIDASKKHPPQDVNREVVS